MAQSDKELELFHRFIGRQLTNGGTSISPDEALRAWKEQAESLLSIQRGLDDVAAGRTTPWEEFDREFRKKNKIPLD